MEMEQYWSPQHAMDAYLNTINLASVLRGGSKSSHHHNHHPHRHGEEPKCMEFLSALAAGNGAKLIVQITSPEGITPLTLALAVAAKQTRGRFIVIIPYHHHHHHHHEEEDDEAMMMMMVRSSRRYINELINPDQDESSSSSMEYFSVKAGNPCEIIKKFKKIDFLVIDSPAGDDYNKLWKNVDVNPKGCLVVVVVVTNLEQRGRKKKKMKKKNSNFRRVIGNGNHEIISITVPVGNGIELLKIRPLPIGPGAHHSPPPSPATQRRYTRFHVTYEN